MAWKKIARRKYLNPKPYPAPFEWRWFRIVFRIVSLPIRYEIHQVYGQPTILLGELQFEG